MSEAEIARDFVRVLKSVLGDAQTQVPLHAPFFPGKEKAYLQDCLDSTFVSSVGQYVDRFERLIEEYTGAPHAVAVVNGTAALHAALVLAGVGPGDEVILPALTFVATANAVSYCGSVPHFADSDRLTLGLDPLRLGKHLEAVVEMRDGQPFNSETQRRIAAVVPVHVFGHSVDMDLLLEVCGSYGIPIVEDAAESLGTFYKGRHTGRLGLLGTLSFNGNKIITTGGGGAILTEDAELARRARHLTTTAKLPHAWKYEHDQVGFNYRMPNINAALGCGQMESLEQFVNNKRRLAERYCRAFGEIEGLECYVEPEFSESNYWLNAVLLNRASGDTLSSVRALRNKIIGSCADAGYMLRPVWNLLPTLPMYQDCPRMNLDCAQNLEARLLCLPSGPGLLAD
ncbi:LegC family aminotransferase [Desulfovibrio ferrophilus]|uniref:GDP-perosamine synthase n=1 Tax=Desulfovibrio ferrophilus TaxID=241368 RepID=A0A2Z6B1H6_9BACT|nr:LegC family aminotransferase [Desulfovibrio ferrophilus]BBD09331.1 DegT/DnrJ/EryC1/StrS aminotransferase family protein [Desulfovibrio ferrophilus]